jgi:sporulation protein YlmC with PRC-barrel domain
MPPKETEPGIGPTLEPTVGAEGMITGTGIITETEIITGSKIITGTGKTLPAEPLDAGRVSNLLNYEVWNQAGVKIGEVEEIVLNLGMAHLDYIVVGTSAETSTGTRFVPVPWEALTVVSAQSQGATAGPPPNSLILTVEQAVFDEAPDIELESIPELSKDATGWDTEIRSYWQSSRAGTEAATPSPDPNATPESPSSTAPGRIARATQMLGFSFEAASIQVKVILSDLIVDVNTGEIQYVVIAIRSESMADVLIPVPPGIISWDPAQESYTLTVGQDVLLLAPIFENGAYPFTQAPDWDLKFRSYWAQYLPVPASLPR